MEANKPGNKKLPDFDQLTDRVILDSPSEPMLVIKTNLDPKDATENNPYIHHQNEKNEKELKDFFNE
ncbi:hypothetical protein HPT25_16275 [Bacillus sp. BRMEA1]|uniref:hypothetical protein n=1 Tax=Neobacillus endophyticus TaxID=2738405 RepID=UPI0015669BCE|nr:hypothetical protein [Neobacillus endophyticus]NRD78921.1 hypothetical protein [Neobacillus endophyticus]